MSDSFKDFDYFGLTPTERILLAQELLDSVVADSQPDAPPLTDQQLAEMQRRASAIDAGEVKCVPWDAALGCLRGQG